MILHLFWLAAVGLCMNLNTRWSNILLDESQVAFAEKYIDPDTTELIAGIELSEAGFERLEAICYPHVFNKILDEYMSSIIPSTGSAYAVNLRKQLILVVPESLWGKYNRDLEKTSQAIFSSYLSTPQIKKIIESRTKYNLKYAESFEGRLSNLDCALLSTIVISSPALLRLSKDLVLPFLESGDLCTPNAWSLSHHFMNLGQIELANYVKKLVSKRCGATIKLIDSDDSYQWLETHADRLEVFKYGALELCEEVIHLIDPLMVFRAIQYSGSEGHVHLIPLFVRHLPIRRYSYELYMALQHSTPAFRSAFVSAMPCGKWLGRLLLYSLHFSDSHLVSCVLSAKRTTFSRRLVKKLTDYILAHAKNLALVTHPIQVIKDIPDEHADLISELVRDLFLLAIQGRRSSTKKLEPTLHCLLDYLPKSVELSIGGSLETSLEAFARLDEELVMKLKQFIQKSENSN